MFISSAEKQLLKDQIADLSEKLSKAESDIAVLQIQYRNWFPLMKEISEQRHKGAPWGYCLNGEPRKKPGRPVKQGAKK